MKNNFQLKGYEIGAIAIKTIVSQHNEQKLLNIAKAEFEKWLQVNNRLWYADLSTNQPIPCPVAEYWLQAHPSHIERDLHDYIAANKFLSNGCAYQNPMQDLRQVQRVKYLCNTLRSMLTDYIVVVNDFQERSISEQHNTSTHIVAFSQDIKALASQLAAAARADMQVDSNGKLSLTTE